MISFGSLVPTSVVSLPFFPIGDPSSEIREDAPVVRYHSRSIIGCDPFLASCSQLQVWKAHSIRCSVFVYLFDFFVYPVVSYDEANP